MKHHNPLLNNAERAHIDNIRANHAAMPENDGNHPTPFRHVADFAARAELFKHVTNLSAFGFTFFYIYAMKSGFNSENVFASIPAVIHVFAAIGISLSMFQLQSNSLMRVVHVLGLLLLANLG